MKTFTIAVYCLLASAALTAQPGSLDYNFGDSGKVISRYFGGCHFMVLQQDNKIVCGATLTGIGFRLVRYLNNGTVDSSFGQEGIADFATPETVPELDGIKIQDDQRIVMGGYGNKNGTPTFIVTRCLPDGSLDESFGVNGFVDTTFGIGESAGAIAIQPDGKILISGWYYPSSYITVRYNTDGSLDESFGNGGTVFTDFGAFVSVGGIAVQSDNKILVGGDSFDPSNFLIVRYMPDGSLDNSFGNKGKVVTNFGPGDEVLTAVALQSDGKIAVAGITNYSNFDNMALAHYESNGTLDTSFGQGGKVTCKFEEPYSKAYSLLIQPDNKLIISGWTFNDVDANFAMARYLPDGTADSSFGINSQVITDMGLIDFSYASALQNNGEIILAGTSFNDEIDFALARYNDDVSKKQIIVTKIRHWIQHHNGIEWDNVNGISSYVVQRSYDGVHFNSIARIHAGNTSNYTYEDASPLNSTNYYHLQTTSVSGAVNYSNVIAVTKEDAIKISPNPATNSLHIEGLSSNKAKLTVVDFAGNIKLQAVVNASSYNLNIALLKTGNYLLKIETNGDVVTKKFVKE